MMTRRKDARLRDIIKREFNFATFVRNILSIQFMIHEVMCIRKAVQYGVDIHVLDPIFKRNALHYAYITDSLDVAVYLEQDLQMTHTLDIYRLPPFAYGLSIPFCNDAMDLPGVIRSKSKKLFNFLFMNIVPKSWSTSVLASITKEEFLVMDESKRQYLLTQARDFKGNTVLHLAAKSNKKDLVEYLLHLDRSLATLKNVKGKTPSSYCKIIDTFSLFNEQWQQDMYFRHQSVSSGLLWEMTVVSPELVEIVRGTTLDTTFVVVNNLDLLCNVYYTVLSKENLNKICRRAVDMAGNTLWHISVLDRNENRHEISNEILNILDVTMINARNNFGETPLHLAKDQHVKNLLLHRGAHPDSLDCNNKLASHIVLNLQCIAARNVPFDSIVPNHLIPIIQLHKPNYRCKSLEP